MRLYPELNVGFFRVNRHYFADLRGTIAEEGSCLLDVSSTVWIGAQYDGSIAGMKKGT